MYLTHSADVVCDVLCGHVLLSEQPLQLPRRGDVSPFVKTYSNDPPLKLGSFIKLCTGKMIGWSVKPYR